MVWHHVCKLLLKHTIITLILLFYPLFGKDNIFCNSLRESRWMQDGCKTIYSFPWKSALCIQWYPCITALLLASLHLFKTWILFWSLSVTVLMFSGFKVRLLAWWLVSGEWENYRSTKRESSFRTADIAVSYIGHSSNVFIQPAIFDTGDLYWSDIEQKTWNPLP